MLVCRSVSSSYSTLLHLELLAGMTGGRPDGGKDVGAAGATAAATTYDAAEIGVRATLTRDPKTRHALQIAAHIDAHDVVLSHEGDSYIGQLRLAIIGYSPGALAQRTPLIPVARDKALTEGIPLVQNLGFPEGMVGCLMPVPTSAE